MLADEIITVIENNWYKYQRKLVNNVWRMYSKRLQEMLKQNVKFFKSENTELLVNTYSFLFVRPLVQLNGANIVKAHLHTVISKSVENLITSTYANTITRIASFVDCL